MPTRRKRKKRYKRKPTEPYRLFERRKLQGNNKHHLVPQYRFPPHFSKRQRGQWGNVKTIPVVSHNAWHDLFEELTPDEAIVYLVEHVYRRGTFQAVSFRVNWHGVVKRRYHYRRRTKSTVVDSSFQIRSGLLHRQIAAYRRLFRKLDPVLVLATIVESWSPPGYFISCFFKARSQAGPLVYRLPAKG